MTRRSRKALDTLMDDLRDHLAREIEENLARGMAPEEARRQAHLALGNLALIAQDTRAVWAWNWLSSVRRDLAYALRLFRRAPGFAAVIVLTLAIGIGANTAVFSVAYAALLKPPPFPHSDRLVALYERNGAHGLEHHAVSPGTYVDWRQRSHALNAMGVYTLGEALWSFGDTYQVVHTAAVTPSIFQMTAGSAILGRAFRPEPEQEKPYGDPGEVVLSYPLWQRLFGGAQDVIGRTVRVEGRFPLHVIGVMPRGFAFPPGVDAWINLTFLRPIGSGERQTRYYHAVGLLAPSVDVEHARRELTDISAQLATEQPRSNAGWSADIEPLRDALAPFDSRVLLVLEAAVVGVLLIGCASVANLLLARTARRRREFAVRLALGATTLTLFRQCVSEALVLTAAGTLSGLLVGEWIIHTFIALIPSGTNPALEVSMNIVGFVFAAILGLACTVLVALAPALQAARADMKSNTNASSRTFSVSHGRTRRALIVAEVAVVLILLASTALLGRTFLKLRDVDLGFAPEQVVALEMRWPTGRFTVASRRPWFAIQQQVDGLLKTIQSAPGVESAALVTDLPLRGEPASGSLWRADAPGAAGSKPPTSAADQWKADITVVTPAYFHVLGMPLLHGRNFSEADRLTEGQLADPEASRSTVALVNKAFVSRFFAGEDALGKKIVLFDDQAFGGVRTIVGIVADARTHAVRELAKPTVYLPFAEFPDVFSPTVVVSSTLPPDAVASGLKARIHDFDSQLLVQRIQSMDSVVMDALSAPRFNLLMVGAFAFTALLLAAVGIAGVVAFLVSERTREIGIRMALGARAVDVMRLVLTEGMSPVIVGAVVGLVASVATTRILGALLYGVTPVDTLSFGAAPIVMMVVALLACYLPARRAVRVDPLVALRDQ
jgi:putative ABC transport system permease protein